MKNIIYGDNLVTLVDSLYITAVSMLIVFSILVVICISLFLLRGLSKFEKKEEVKSSKKVVNGTKKVEKVGQPEVQKYEFENLKNKIDDENVRLAIITACIEASEEFGHNDIKINYVREV